MINPLRIFVGFDSREPVAFHVLCHSILARASSPVTITPLVLGHLHGSYTRQRGPTESTEFSMTRFLVPFLSDFHGYSLFMDCDMLVLTDIATIMDEVKTNTKDVWVCQHDYVPKSQTKFLGNIQTSYPRKNWSSVMLFNCNNQSCRRLTPEYVNSATGLELHRFQWCEDERIGSLPLEWNWLVGEYEPNPQAKILHWTNGGPWFDQYSDVDHAKEWRAELESMEFPCVIELPVK